VKIPTDLATETQIITELVHLTYSPSYYVVGPRQRLNRRSTHALLKIYRPDHSLLFSGTYEQTRQFFAAD
jgi:hypothetical protein